MAEKIPYSLSDLQDATVRRHEQQNDDPVAFDSPDWALAANGAMGYVAYLLTRTKMGDDVGVGEIYDEIGDAIIYLALLCASLGGDLSEVVARKFNTNSKELDSDILLPAKSV